MPDFTLFKNNETVEDVRHLLTNPVLRDIYDKTGTFTSEAEYKERNGQIPQSMRYIQALGGCMHYMMFFIMIFFTIDKHVRKHVLILLIASLR